jgi:hypothetical protein
MKGIRLLFNSILQEILSSHNRSDGFWDPPILLLNGYWVYFLEINRPGHEVDGSTPCNAEVKNEWSYTSTSPTCLQGICMDNFTFSFTSSNNIFMERGGGVFPVVVVRLSFSVDSTDHVAWQKVNEGAGL